MSMIANYVAVPADQMATLRQDETEFRNFITNAPEFDRHFDLDQIWDALAWLISESARQKAIIAHQWKRLAEGEMIDVPADPGSTAADDLEVVIKGSAEKWHPKVDFGYGPASIISPAVLARTLKSISNIDQARLVREFDPPKMLGVYPDGWQNADPSVVKEGIAPAFDQFRRFLADAEKNGEAIIIYFD